MQSMLKRSAVRATATARRAIYTPSERTLEFIAREDAVSAHNYHPLPVVLTKGRGCKVWDVDGKGADGGGGREEAGGTRTSGFFGVGGLHIDAQRALARVL